MRKFMLTFTVQFPAEIEEDLPEDQVDDILQAKQDELEKVLMGTGAENVDFDGDDEEIPDDKLPDDDDW